ncbi:MAG: alpha/beta hydrolase [Ahrensia sp.]|nr:alpha/beta hydrolase [Ahrensia sp.]
MPELSANGLTLYYEDEGPRNGRPIVLVMGLGVQSTAWPAAFLDALHWADYRTIRFDNRDIGLSSRLEGRRARHIALHIITSRLGLGGGAPYALTDMADDTLGLIEALELERPHLVGVSMGGMIGQIIAARAGSQLASFTAIMTSTNNPRLPKPRRDVLKMLIAPGPAPKTHDEAVERAIRLWNTIGTQNGGGTQEDLRERVDAALRRSFYPAGLKRQIAAIIETGDLRRWTRKISLPTLVLHGTADPLVPASGGKDVAANIMNSRLHLLDGMGHDLPPKFLAELTGELVEHLRTSDSMHAQESQTTSTVLAS